MSTGEQWWRDLTEGINDDPVYWAESIANTLAIEFKKQLDKKSITQKELSRRLEVSKPYVSQVLNGKSNMTLITLCKLAHALDLRPTVEMEPKELEIAELDTTNVNAIILKSMFDSQHSSNLLAGTVNVTYTGSTFFAQYPEDSNFSAVAAPTPGRSLIVNSFSLLIFLFLFE